MTYTLRTVPAEHTAAAAQQWDGMTQWVLERSMGLHPAEQPWQEFVLLALAMFWRAQCWSRQGCRPETVAWASAVPVTPLKQHMWRAPCRRYRHVVGMGRRVAGRPQAAAHAAGPGGVIENEDGEEAAAATEADAGGVENDVPALLQGEAAADIKNLPFVHTLVAAIAALRTVAGDKLDHLLPPALQPKAAAEQLGPAEADGEEAQPEGAEPGGAGLTQRRTLSQ